MTQEDKELLLKDLCSRLPYGVICSTPNGDGHLCSINQTIFGNKYGVNIEATKRDYFNDNECSIKPYLRPMCSITLEELWEFRHFSDHIRDAECKIHITNYKQINWLNAHHFDYRTDDEGKTMIEKGVALEAPEEMYKNVCYKYFPNEFSSYEDYIKYLKEKGFALEAPDGMQQ